MESQGLELPHLTYNKNCPYPNISPFQTGKPTLEMASFGEVQLFQNCPSALLPYFFLGERGQGWKQQGRQRTGSLDVFTVHYIPVS
jgi:hypothetical protein